MSKCWHCGKEATSVWHTTWDAPGQEWPMCGRCGAGVMQGQRLRAAGRQREADAMDERTGIDTSGSCGRWIPPA